MIPSISFPEGNLKLVEFDPSNKRVIQIIEELPTSSGNRLRLQNLKNDLLMVNHKANLHIVENYV